MPLAEYNYRGELPPTVEANFSLASDFAAELARDADLSITGEVPLTGNPKLDSTSIVETRPTDGSRVVVTIMTHRPSNTLFIGVAGDIESTTAKNAAAKAKALFHKRYPGAKLTEFTRKQGLLGP